MDQQPGVPLREDKHSSRATEVTRLLQAVSEGQERASDELLGLVYDELRSVASRLLRGERSDHTLQPTALVHEAFLRLFGDQPATTYQDRTHFFAVAGTAMRRILIDHARAAAADKRGGGCGRAVWSDVYGATEQSSADLVALDEALSRLAITDPVDARVVELRFFVGLGMEEIAAVLGVTDRTVRRHWNYAKAWLYREMTRDDSRFSG